MTPYFYFVKTIMAKYLKNKKSQTVGLGLKDYLSHDKQSSNLNNLIP
ncbi:hypothetical protein HMPREF9148_01077 [Prevotella sp. F0091]|nr:hypothetical protein HMPREF9148_01077 [Prevotella sp. F0091]